MHVHRHRYFNRHLRKFLGELDPPPPGRETRFLPPEWYLTRLVLTDAAAHGGTSRDIFLLGSCGNLPRRESGRASRVRPTARGSLGPGTAAAPERGAQPKGSARPPRAARARDASRRAAAGPPSRGKRSAPTCQQQPGTKRRAAAEASPLSCVGLSVRDGRLTTPAAPFPRRVRLGNSAALQLGAQARSSPRVTRGEGLGPGQAPDEPLAFSLVASRAGPQTKWRPRPRAHVAAFLFPSSSAQDAKPGGGTWTRLNPPARKQL